MASSQLSALLDRSGRLQAFFFLRKNAQSIDLLVPEAVARHCVDRLESHVIADDVAIRGRDVGPMRLAARARSGGDGRRARSRTGAFPSRVGVDEDA